MYVLGGGKKNMTHESHLQHKVKQLVGRRKDTFFSDFSAKLQKIEVCTTGEPGWQATDNIKSAKA